MTFNDDHHIAIKALESMPTTTAAEEQDAFKRMLPLYRAAPDLLKALEMHYAAAMELHAESYIGTATHRATVEAIAKAKNGEAIA